MNPRALLLLLFLVAPVTFSRGQELEPRAFWIGPVKTNAATFSYAYSTGDFAFDPSVPVEGVESTVNSLQAGYYHSLNFFGRSSNLTLTLPYAWGPSQGEVLGDFQQVHLSGLGDPRLRFSVNLLGAPAMTIPEFQEFRRKHRTILGLAFRVQFPLGQYDPNRLVNLGSNRWAFKPQLGVIHPIKPDWLIELSVGSWFFTENRDFVGSVRQQDPLLDGQFHLIHRIGLGFWAAFDATYYWGGRTTVDGEKRFDLQRNMNAGGTISIPVARGHNIKFTGNTGLSIDYGGDRTTFAVAYQYTWLGE
jgi:hypothetical protein